ncbi:MAG: hypothetical protein KF732_00220 [Flavobacteriales bacterium]|nr:hypothetical protein [Flavobacteriales bacterium]MBV6483616.1 hypothetical protein [Flavobacteriales bacterium]MBX2958356.1 hypothetical protein [Flavobacteriales bacterium]HRP58788.1 hypothetical protein [Vicingus sp.]
MKKFLFTAVLLSAFVIESQAQKQYKIITTIESIVPGGLGRSRIIEGTSVVDAAQFTTQRTDGKDSKQGDIKRSDAKIDELNETKILNFYSMVGLNFQNIASNDAMITSILNTLSEQGWELFTVVSGVESDAGKEDGNGIFITRYIFRK